MGMQRDGSEDAVIAYFGDGASSEGDVNEAFIFAASYNAPVVFFLQNNQWAISVPEERQSRIPLFRRAHGFGFPGVRVDGNDVLACLAVTRKALQHAREGQGPFLIEAFTYRMGAHTTSDDPTRYRLASELENWKLRDPIERVKAYLSRNGLADAAFYEAIDAEAAALAARVRTACLSMPEPNPADIFKQVYAGGSPLVDEERAAFDEYQAGYEPATIGRRSVMGAPVAMARALNMGLRKALESDPKVMIMGEDVGKMGGVFRVTDGLQKDFGEDRVMDTPLAESGIIGTAIGLAMRGYRPICEIQFDGFVFPAFDQIVSQLAKLHYRSQGRVAMPVVDPHPVRRWHRRGRAPQRIARGVVRARRRPQGRRVFERSRRVHDDSAGGREQRSDHLLRAEAALLGEGRARRRHTSCGSRRVARGARRQAWSASDVGCLRTDGEDLPRRRAGGRRRGPRTRGRRPEVAVTRRLADADRLGASHRAMRRRPRGTDVSRHGCRTRGTHHRTVLL